MPDGGDAGLRRVYAEAAANVQVGWVMTFESSIFRASKVQLA